MHPIICDYIHLLFVIIIAGEYVSANGIMFKYCSYHIVNSSFYVFALLYQTFHRYRSPSLMVYPTTTTTLVKSAQQEVCPIHKRISQDM